MKYLKNYRHNILTYIALPFCNVHINLITLDLIRTRLALSNGEVVVICESTTDKPYVHPNYVTTIIADVDKVKTYFHIFKPLDSYAKLMIEIYNENLDMSEEDVQQIITYSGLEYNKFRKGKYHTDVLILALLNYPEAYEALYESIKCFYDENDCPVKHIGDGVWQTEIPLVILENDDYFKNLNITQWKSRNLKEKYSQMLLKL